MSGITGNVRWPDIARSVVREGAPQVLEADLERMAAALAHRGPNGIALWTSLDDQVGLGHLALHAAPEAQVEHLPLRCASREIVLCCDARLDNRDELLPQLESELAQVLGDASTQVSACVGDSALILAAYLRWNRDCARHLLGDFALAIWDGEAQHLFCARDHVGVKPFYFHFAPEQFVFASEIKGLFEAPGVPREPNQERIAEYLTGSFGSHGSHESTSFLGIGRLPAAHPLLVSERGLEMERFWDVRQVEMLRGLSDAEYESRFREVLFEAVRCRMRAPVSEGAVGGFLSGGMDSSAVVCVAREVRRQEGRQDELLPVFSAIYEHSPECDERPWMQAVLGMGGLQEHWLDGEARAPLSGLETVLWHTDEPIIGPNLCAAWAHYRAVREHGARIILDGHGGDETIGHGHARLNELVQSGQWQNLWRELRLAQSNGFDLGDPAERVMWRALSHGVRPLRRALRVAHGVARRLPKRAPRDSEAQQSGGARPVDLLNPEFAARIGAEEKHRAWQAQQPRNAMGDRKLCEALLSGPLQELAFEELDKAAAAAQVEARYPLWDKRLVEFCLSLPSDQKRRDGWSRSILRRALDGILPPEVQWRASKNDFSRAAVLSVRQHEAERVRQVEQGELPQSSRYVDVALAARCAQQLLHFEPEDMEDAALPFVVRAAALESWLQAQIEPSVDPPNASCEAGAPTVDDAVSIVGVAVCEG